MMSSRSREEVVGSATNFCQWLQRKGAYLHPALRFFENGSGMSVVTTEDLDCDSKVVSCHFSLAITPQSSKVALLALSKPNSDSEARLDALCEHELICTYIVVHWLLDEDLDGSELKSVSTAASHFDHLPYLQSLPSSDMLRTPLHFNQAELLLLRGTNLYGATLDRQKARQSEWERCRTYAETLRPLWKDRFTWQRYLTAATYLSSRAFPSTILSPTPSLVPSASLHPVLIPGVDSFNHARGHRVSWVVDPIQLDVSLSAPCDDPYQISLVIHKATTAHTEVFNNYGAKPNSEFLLGYGFSLPANPDDTIVLKIGGRRRGLEKSSKAWEVGRDGRGAEGLWAEMVAVFAQGSDGDEEIVAQWEDELEAAETLKDMVEQKLMALPNIVEGVQDGIRRDVLLMIQHYVEGQRDILQSLSAFADRKRECAVARAKQDGVELVFDDEVVDMV